MKETRISRIAQLTFDEKEQILEVKVLENAEMNLENTKEHYEEIKKLTGNKKHYALIDASNYFTADAEALKYASSKEAIENRLAAAHYNATVANKLTTNFFSKSHQPPIPLQIFNTREEAIAWLRSLAEN